MFNRNPPLRRRRSRVNPVPNTFSRKAQLPPRRRTRCFRTVLISFPASNVLWRVLAGVLLAGCGGGDSLLLPSQSNPSEIKVARGSGQSGRVGTALKDPIVVQVNDGAGRPVEGATVAFQMTSGGPGSEIAPDTMTTDANGEASAFIVLGTTTGAQNGEARLVIDGGIAQSASFTALAVPENANSMAAIGGEDQTGHVNAPLDEPLVVQVTDAFGNPIEGVPVAWEAKGGGSVSE